MRGARGAPLEAQAGAGRVRQARGVHRVDPVARWFPFPRAFFRFRTRVLAHDMTRARRVRAASACVRVRRLARRRLRRAVHEGRHRRGEHEERGRYVRRRVQSRHDVRRPRAARERAERGDADRAARLPRGIEHGRRGCGARAFDRGEHRRRHRGHREPHAARNQQERHDEHRDRRIGTHRAQQRETGRADQRAGDHRPARAVVRGRPAARDVRQQEAPRERQEREPCLERRVVAHALQIQAQHEDDPVVRQIHADTEQHGDAERAPPEQRERHHRVRAARFDEHERGARRERDRDERRMPVDHRAGEERERDDGEALAGQVEAACSGAGGALGRGGAGIRAGCAPVRRRVRMVRAVGGG
ncbi:major facilitator superfamily MFS_1 domain protein [Burkholderia mallei]|nr:major facilitator superfamily MFS_1 domain protein [Burkholderia mallei]